MKRLSAMAIGLGLLGPLHASHLDELRRQAEASMVLTGDITVDAHGAVSGYRIDHAGQVPVDVRRLLDQSIPHWVFEPPQHDGQPVAAHTPMSLRVVAAPQADGDFTLSVTGTWFGEKVAADPQGISVRRQVVPTYPQELAREGVSGTVYLLLDIGRDGEVRQVAAEQVDLDVIGEPPQMAAWRKALAASAMSAFRRMLYNVPARGSLAQRDHWIVRVPVAYSLVGGPVASVAYGHWAVYLPGPRNLVAWAEQPGDNPADALPGEGIYTGQPALHRLLAQHDAAVQPPANP